MCAVVGNDRCLCLCICFLDRTDFILGHIDRTEDKVYACRNLFNLVDVGYNDIFDTFRHRDIDPPSVAYRIFIALACRTRAGCDRGYLKPRMSVQDRDETLSYHTGSAKDSYF